MVALSRLKVSWYRNYMLTEIASYIHGFSLCVDRAVVSRQIIGNKFWFIDIPRTGTSSLKDCLGQMYGHVYGKSYDRERDARRFNLIKDHATSRQLVTLLGSEAWGNLYTFTFVRNPWDRYLSLYRYRIASGSLNESVSFEQYVHALRGNGRCAKCNPFDAEVYHRSMSSYILDANDNVLVKHVFRYEDRESGLGSIETALGIRVERIHKERLGDGDYRNAYSQEMSNIVGEFYSEDVSLFCYDF